MSNDKNLVWVKRIVRRPGSDPVIEDDIIYKEDIRRIRRWHKNDKDSTIKGDITQLNVKLDSGMTVSIQINESLESISERLGNVHKIDN